MSISEEKLEELRKEEIAWRKDSKTLELFAEAEASGLREWIDVVEEYQKDLIKRNFSEEQFDEALNKLQNAHLFYPDNKVFTEDSFWVKYNRFSFAKDFDIHDGDDLIECDLYERNKTKHSLLELSNEKPIAIITGSYTWPPFRGLIDKYSFLPKSILEEFFDKYGSRDNLNIFVVYIEEAHAIDEWDIGLKIRIPVHKCIEDRIKAIEKMEEEMEFKFPILIDGMENKLSRSYNAWPIRLLFFHKGKMIYRPPPQNCNFDLEDFGEFIDKYICDKKT